MHRTCSNRLLKIVFISKKSKKCSSSSTSSSSSTFAAPQVMLPRMTSMRAWQLDNYRGIEALRLNEGVDVPTIRGNDKLLIEVKAASVNPLDIIRTDGYGAKVIHAMRCVSNKGCSIKEFPLTLGRDFSGIVRIASHNVRQFAPGDEVMGFVEPQHQGCHAEFVMTNTNCVVKKPKQLSHVEAASLPYVGLTAWSSLCIFGGVRQDTAKGKRALIIGGSGGVGTFSIQLLKAWGMHVTTVVNADAVHLVTSLGADFAVDYTKFNWEESLRQLEGFDVILNCTTSLSSTFAMECLKVWSNATYIHTMSPLLRNIDAFGWPLGLANSAAEFGFDAINALSKGKWYRWGYILPSKKALEEIATLVEQKKIRPVVDEVFMFDNTLNAYGKVRQGHARGKTVISFEGGKESSSTSGLDDRSTEN